MRFGRRQSVLVLLSVMAMVSQCCSQTSVESGSAQSPAVHENRSTSSNAVVKKPKLITIVTVTGQPLSVALAPAAANVVDDEQIRSANALTSADIMRNVAFVNMEQNGSAGSLSTVTIRGGKPNLVLMMIDGIPVNDLSNLLGGAFDFSTLLTHDIERVEVVRGPLSSGYGSEAMSGVINVITKPAQYEPEATIGVEGGSFGSAGVDMGAQGSLGRLGYRWNGAFLRVGEQVELDSFSASTFSTSSDYAIGSNSTVSWTGRWIQFDRSGFPENGGGPELSILRIPKTSDSGNFLGGFLFQHRFSEVWSSGINADVFTRGEHSYTPAILDNLNPSPFSQPSTLTNSRFTRARVTFQNALQFTSKLQAHLNLQGGDEIGDNDTLIANAFTSRFSSNRGVFGGTGDAIYSSTHITGMAALGINKTAGFPTQFAPRVGAALPVTGNTIVKVSWGQAYKVPSLYALGNPSVGNPGLRPEKVSGMDVGVQRRFGNRFSLSGTYYYNLFSNLIDFSATAFQLVNRTRVRTEGMETEASLSVIHGVQMKAWGSFLNWKMESSTEPLRDQPDWQAGFSMDARLPKQLHVSGTTVWEGRRYDFQLPAPEIDSVGGYSTTNLVMGYDGFRRISLFARVDNLFNSRFHEYLGFPNPGISCRIGVRYHLR